MRALALRRRAARQQRGGQRRPRLARAAAALWLAAAVVAAGTTAAPLVYRWVDEAGNVHYSDEPREGATLMNVDPVPGTKFERPMAAAEPAAPESVAKDAAVDYQVSIANLQEGGVVWNDARQLPVELRVEPGLKTHRGHRIIVYIDGALRAGPAADQRLVIDAMDRGTHTVEAVVVDAEGRALATTGPVRFTHKQHSRLLPAAGD